MPEADAIKASDIKDVCLDPNSTGYFEGAISITAYWAFALSLTEGEQCLMRNIIMDNGYCHSRLSRRNVSKHPLYRSSTDRISTECKDFIRWNRWTNVNNEFHTSTSGVQERGHPMDSTELGTHQHPASYRDIGDIRLQDYRTELTDLPEAVLEWLRGQKHVYLRAFLSNLLMAGLNTRPLTSNYATKKMKYTSSASVAGVDLVASGGSTTARRERQTNAQSAEERNHWQSFWRSSQRRTRLSDITLNARTPPYRTGHSQSHVI
ncbi:hypothetical protein V8C35DRAFT_276298 [Trichoderma chlorosporum]